MFTFDPLLPSGKDRIRLALGDFTAPGLRADETINVMIAASGEAEAAAKLAEGLAAEYAQRPDSIGTDGSSIRWSERVKTWLEIAARMRANAGGGPLGSASRVASRGDDEVAEYLRPSSWVWGD